MASTPRESRPALCASLGLKAADNDMFDYGLSKACLTAYTLMLAKQHPELIVSACTPGYV